MSVLSGIGQVPSVFGTGSGGNYNPSVYGLTTNTATGGQLDDDYLFSGITLQANTDYLVSIIIPLTSFTGGSSVDIADAQIAVELVPQGGSPISLTTILLPDYASASEFESLTSTFVLSVGTATNLSFIQLQGSYTSSAVTFNYGANGIVTFTQLNNFQV